MQATRGAINISLYSYQGEWFLRIVTWSKMNKRAYKDKTSAEHAQGNKKLESVPDGASIQLCHREAVAVDRRQDLTTQPQSGQRGAWATKYMFGHM